MDHESDWELTHKRGHISSSTKLSNKKLKGNTDEMTCKYKDSRSK
jgi:hypothetical protein